MTTANPACRRYLKKLSLGFAVYAATLMIMNAILDNYTVPYALSILLVLLPMAPVVYIIRVVETHMVGNSGKPISSRKPQAKVNAPTRVKAIIAASRYNRCCISSRRWLSGTLLTVIVETDRS